MTTYRQLQLADMDFAAAVHRSAFDERLPWLAGLHSAAEDRDHFRNRVFNSCVVWGGFDDGQLVGIVAFRDGWIDHLYVLPRFQGRGIGGALLKVAKAAFPSLSLWTFQRNEAARRFYETRGFRVVETTDGAANDEREPDVRYSWERDTRR